MDRYPANQLQDKFWRDAASVFETATAAADGSTAQLAILIDDRSGLRIVDSTGWSPDALRREYGAQAAYTVARSGSAVIVEGHNGASSCRLTKDLPAALLMSSSIPHHLIRPLTA